MINTLSILFGLGGMILVVARAFLLNRTLPWFVPAPVVVPEKKEVRIR